MSILKITKKSWRAHAGGRAIHILAGCVVLTRIVQMTTGSVSSAGCSGQVLDHFGGPQSDRMTLAMDTGQALGAN